MDVHNVISPWGAWYQYIYLLIQYSLSTHYMPCQWGEKSLISQSLRSGRGRLKITENKYQVKISAVAKIKRRKGAMESWACTQCLIFNSRSRKASIRGDIKASEGSQDSQELLKFLKSESNTHINRNWTHVKYLFNSLINKAINKMLRLFRGHSRIW